MNQPSNEPTPYLRVDFHTHSVYSKDSLSTPEKIIAVSRKKGLDRVVITDHNAIEGALRAKELDPERIIVGEEIMTTRGEILAAYLTEFIPPGLSPLETIERLKAQNAFISVSHPFDFHRKGWQPADLLEIVPHLDAIETFNARCMFPWQNWQAENFASAQNLPGTHGSDAHALFELGRGSLLVPAFDDADTLRKNIRKAKSPLLTHSAPWVHFTSRYAVWRKRLSSR